MATATQPKEPNQPETAVAVREQTAIQKVREALDERAEEIAKLGMEPERFIRVSMMAFAKNPALTECSRSSLVLSILEAAQVGLEPTGGVGGAHLVPFRDKSGQKHAQLIYDYRGVQHLIRIGGGGEVKTVLVYEGDDFEVREGTTDARIDHSPKYQTTDPAKVRFVYAVPLDNPLKFEVMTREQVEAVRARSKSPNAGPWVTDWGPQARKTVLKRISAWLPLRPEVRDALDMDTMRDLPGPSEAATKSRASEVRDMLDERKPRRRRAASPPETAPDAPKGTEDAQVTTPDESAAQQPASEPTDVVDGVTSEVCGAGSDPKLGDVETCIAHAGHLEGDPAPPQVHKGESGNTWPAAKP